MRAGYRFGLSQHDQSLTLQFKALSPALSLETLDARLAALIAFRPGALPLRPEWAPDQTLAMALSARILQVAAELQRSVHLPAFDAGKVLTCDPMPDQPGGWVMTLAVPAIDYFPPPILHQLYSRVTTLVLNLANPAHIPGNIEQLSNEVDTEIRLPARSAVPLSQSTYHLLRTAQAAGMPWRHTGNGIFQIGWGERQTRVRSSQLWGDTALGCETAQHKYWAAQWLSQAGLPAAQHGVANTEAQAFELARQLGNKVVIKPVDRDRGEGITVLPQGEEALRHAFLAAQEYSPQVLVEAWAPGVCHRVLVVKDKMVYAVKRLPIAVEGDGVNTIADLIRRANERRQGLPVWQRKPPLPDDTQTQACLQLYGLSLNDVLPTGQWAPLRDIESTAWGGIDLEMTDRIHPENIVLAIRAAQVFGLTAAGVDIMSTDITRPWYENGAIINEVNVAPLLGGGPASLRTLPALIAHLLPNGAHIPIDVYLGGPEALQAAQERHATLCQSGVNAFLCTPDQTWSSHQKLLPTLHQNLFDRCLIQLGNPHAGHLVVVIQNTEFLTTGLPFNRCATFTVVDAQKCQSAQTGALASDEEVRQLLSLFSPPARDQSSSAP
ncbi:hypothetical protein [Pusillimonas sp. NJUB218]|uniref:hypothetical protein n=1 Tax=Pusillimonas sp. NJUB218 TaxID=2023230 RepID=UPI000F4C7FE2|nr:hypothetical protein [Pusillimonas sp. NJUB218]ROT44845.1 hypothetical protein CHR62_10460 [Pusillimonas sp. NJUB218]